MVRAAKGRSVSCSADCTSSGRISSPEWFTEYDLLPGVEVIWNGVRQVS